MVLDDQRNVTAKLVAPELQARIDKLRDIIDAGLIDAKSNSNGEKKYDCTFIMILIIFLSLQKNHLQQLVRLSSMRSLKKPVYRDPSWQNWRVK